MAPESDGRRTWGWSTVNLDEEKQQQDVRRARSWASWGRCRSLVGWALGWGLSSALPPWGRVSQSPGLLLRKWGIQTWCVVG